MPALIRTQHRRWPRLLAIPLLLAIAVACAQVPYTGRSQLSLVSDGEMAQLGRSAFRQHMRDVPRTRDRRAIDRVYRISARVTAAAERPDIPWQVEVFEDDSPNAFALPSGQIGVHTGIIDVADNDAQLATVIAHEVAHVLARHGAERVSQDMAAQIGTTVASVALTGNDPGQLRSTMALLGMGTQVGFLLPYARAHESEADRIGMILMAKAGYDPREAVGFWRNMAAQSQGGAPPEFLSTHPADATRIADIQRLMPEALGYYRPDGNRATVQTAAADAVAPASGKWFRVGRPARALRETLMHRQPNAGAEPVAVIGEGARVQVIGRNERTDWLEVRSDNGLRGFALGRDLREVR